MSYFIEGKPEPKETVETLTLTIGKDRIALLVEFLKDSTSYLEEKIGELFEGEEKQRSLARGAWKLDQVKNFMKDLDECL